MTHDISVLWITNIPSPYRVDFFEQLGRKTKLTVIFEKSVSDERDTSWRQDRFSHFNAVFLNGVKTGTDSAFDRKIRCQLKNADQYSFVVVSDPLTPMGMYAISYFRRHHICFYTETDGGFPKTGQGFKEKIKKHFISSAAGWFSTAAIHDEYYRQYGADPEKIYRYPFTSVGERDILQSPLTPAEKRQIKDRLGIREDKMILSVGQFIPRKGLDLLLQVADRFCDTAFVLLGGQETEEYRLIREQKKLTNVYYPGFIDRFHIGEYYRAADLFVLPTREDIWGLVINEAMAYGLPVISTERCIAATELIHNGKNGYVLPVEDTKCLAESIASVLADDALRETMARQSLSIIQHYTIEKMAEWHTTFFEKKLSDKEV